MATRLTDGGQQLLLATRLGQAVRFNEAEVRTTGRDTRGVKGISLRQDDAVVSMAVVGDDDDLLSITENGYGKISSVADYRHTHRGGKGVITIKLSDRNGPVVAVRRVDKQEDLMVMNNEGKVIRLNLGEIRSSGRNTMGVRIMRLAPGERVVAVVPVPPAPPEEEPEE